MGEVGQNSSGGGGIFRNVSLEVLNIGAGTESAWGEMVNSEVLWSSAKGGGGHFGSGNP